MEVIRTQRLDESSPDVDELLTGDAAQELFTLLDRFPVTPVGHVGFLEFVGDEVHNAAEAKRQQLPRGYSNNTLANMVRDIKWAEAGQRVSALSGLPTTVTEQVARVLRRELNVGTVEQIDELLTPLLRMLRDTYVSAAEVTVMEPPELIELRRWLATDGIKGQWRHCIASLEWWHLEVDKRHQDIAFLLRHIMGGDPPEDAIRDYLFQAHGILPSDPINLVKLEQLLKEDAEQVRTCIPNETYANDSELIERLGAGPVDAELTPRELTLLEAYLKQPVALSQIQREKQITGESETNAKRNKLKLIRDFNRNLRAATLTVTDADPAADPKEVAENRQTVADPATMPAQTTERGDDEAEAIPAESDVAHSTDFRSVRWFGERFTFTTTQAACVQVLWRNWQQGTPVISEVTVLDNAGSAGDRLRDVFDKGKHPAWGTLIQPAGKGAFCLAEPDES